MKRSLLALLIALCLFWTVDVLGDASTQKDADASITEGYGYIRGIVVITDGTNAVTVDIYDNSSATGRKLIPTWVVTTSATDRAQAMGWGENELYYYKGIYVDITTAGTVAYMVYYDAKRTN